MQSSPIFVTNPVMGKAIGALAALEGRSASNRLPYSIVTEHAQQFPVLVTDTFVPYTN